MAELREAADARYRHGKHPSCCCFRCMVWNTIARMVHTPFQPLLND
jgi:hypothetical protein